MLLLQIEYYVVNKSAVRNNATLTPIVRSFQSITCVFRREFTNKTSRNMDYTLGGWRFS